MFRGTHLTRLDEKGRLKVPAEFKRLIDENYSAQFYITSWDGKSAKVYPMQEWEEIERKLAAVPELQQDQAEISEAHQLLRTIGGVGWARPLAAAADSARYGESERRSCGDGQVEASGGAQCRRAAQGSGRSRSPRKMKQSSADWAFRATAGFGFHSRSRNGSEWTTEFAEANSAPGGGHGESTDLAMCQFF